MREQSGVKPRSKQKDAFAAFDSTTSDAWEVNDEELLMLKARQLSLEKQRSEQAEKDALAQQALMRQDRLSSEEVLDEVKGHQSRGTIEFPSCLLQKDLLYMRCLEKSGALHFVESRRGTGSCPP